MCAQLLLAVRMGIHFKNVNGFVRFATASEKTLRCTQIFKFIDSSKMAEALPSAAKIKILEAVPLLTTSSDMDTI